MSVKQPITPEAIQSRIVGHGDVDPAELVANPRNWRTHPPEQRAALIAELDRVGWVQSVIVNRTTGHLVDGHLRAEVAAERGVGTIPVAWVELTPEEEARVLVALDPLGSMAGTNDALLQDLLAEVDLQNRELEKHLVTFLAGGKGGATEPDDVPAVPEGPAVYVKPGDVWLLGDHRLMCGDSTSAGDVARLLDGAKPSLMITDPPYGVEYDPAIRTGTHAAPKRRMGQVLNDDRAGWQPAWDLAPCVVAYVWHASLRTPEAWGALDAAGFEVRAVIIWDKGRMVFGRSNYHWQHEPCFYAVRKGESAGWIGTRDQTTVWAVDFLSHAQQATPEDPWTDHSTQKPVEVMERPMRNHAGDVYEPFSGSGTTLIAAERLGRRCFAMELSPAFVQVAITRWQEFTGREATRG